MSYFTQMAGLAFHNFVSAAAGIAVAIAVIRGFVRRSAKTIGNFWVDLTRATLWVLLPICVIVSRWCWCGRECRRTSAPTRTSRRSKAPSRSSRRGRSRRRKSSRSSAPTAAASSTPTRRIRIENPTPLTNLLEMLAIFAIGAALTHTFGKMAGDRRQGWALFAAMGLLFLMGVAPRDLGRAARQSAVRRDGHQPAPRAPPRAAATWRARRSASASSTRRCGRRSRPTPRAARSTRCTTASRRSAAWFRWSTCRSARSSSAASARGCTGCW